MVGPSPELLGGMASVCGQMASLGYDDRYTIELFPLTFSAEAGESTHGRVGRHVGHLQRLAQTLRRTNASIVHVHTCSGFSFDRSVADMAVAQTLGCRVVLHIHGAAFDRFFEEAGPLRRRWIAGSLARADAVIALSEVWRRKLETISPSARLTVIENAVESPSVETARCHVGPCRFLLLARMDAWKGIDDLLDAGAALRAEDCTFELVLAGPDGTAGDAGALAEKIHRRGLQSAVRYAGPVRGQEKTDLLRWADVYVQPSHHEGMPISLLEALAYGLPIVATNVGAVPEVVRDGVHGRVVPPHRPELLAVAMGELARRGELRCSLSAAAVELARDRFSLARFERDLLAVYDTIDNA
jgi:glycosyltransferase involved in cell wall biosynthesis